MLIDNALSPQLAHELAEAGFDVVHVRDLGLASADDLVVLETARDAGRIVVSRDGDFSALLALAGARAPSFVHLRTSGVNQASAQATLILRALKTAAAELASGAIVTIRGDKLRIRLLPVRS